MLYKVTNNKTNMAMYCFIDEQRDAYKTIVAYILEIQSNYILKFDPFKLDCLNLEIDRVHNEITLTRIPGDDWTTIYMIEELDKNYIIIDEKEK